MLLYIWNLETKRLSRNDNDDNPTCSPPNHKFLPGAAKCQCGKVKDKEVR